MQDQGSEGGGPSILALRQMLEQLEQAQGGGVDSEARRKLQALEAQLELLQAAQQQAASTAPPAEPTEELVVRLGSRLSELEGRVERLDPGAREVVGATAASWLQAGVLLGGAGQGEAPREAGGDSGKLPP